MTYFTSVTSAADTLGKHPEPEGAEPCRPAEALGSDWLFEFGAEALCNYNKEVCGQEEPGCFLKSHFTNCSFQRAFACIVLLPSEYTESSFNYVI